MVKGNTVQEVDIDEACPLLARVYSVVDRLR